MNAIKGMNLIQVVSMVMFSAATMTPLTASARVTRQVTAGHLYVGNVPDGRQFTKVVRYPLTNGIPAKRPDMTYPGAQGPIWVDGTNHLYALVMSKFGFLNAVAEYAPNSTKRIRSIDLVSPRYDAYSSVTFRGLTVDGMGNLYVATREDAYSPPALHCAWQISVYGPTQRGYSTPLQCLPSAAPFSLAADPSGSLYVAASRIADDSVFVIANAATNPGLIRTLHGPAVHAPIATALDPDGMLYVMGVSEADPKVSYVAVFRHDANGRVTPLRTIFSRNGPWTGGIAVDGAHLYVAAGSAVHVYNKLANGHPEPLATLSFDVSSVNFIALGP